MLTAQIIGLESSIHAAQEGRDRGCQRWCAQRQISIHDGLATGLNQFGALHSSDRSLQATGAHQLLFHPGRLPDQKTKRVGSNASLLVARPELVQVAGNFRRG